MNSSTTTKTTFMTTKTNPMEQSAKPRVLPAAASESTMRRLLESATAVQRWVEANGYRGYEPFDGLSSPLRALTCGNLLAERILQQAVRQSPVNIRPLIGIKPRARASRTATPSYRSFMSWLSTEE